MSSWRVETLNVGGPSRRLPGEMPLRVGDRPIEPGFAAVLGPIGIDSLRSWDDLNQIRLIRGLAPNIAIASLSSLYASTTIRDPSGFDEAQLRDASKSARDYDARFAQQAGLTVAWPMPDEDIAFSDE